MAEPPPDRNDDDARGRTITVTGQASAAGDAAPPLAADGEIGPGATMGRYGLVERIGEGRPLSGIAEAAIALHQPGRAVQAYERALALTSDDDPLHPSVAFGLAKLLRPSAPARAAALAATARALFVAEGAAGAAQLASVDAWLRSGAGGGR